MKVNKHQLKFLIEPGKNFAAFSSEEWISFCRFCFDHGLSTLLYHKIRSKRPPNFPENEQNRLKNLYELSFNHHARIEFEAITIKEKLSYASIPFLFLKGYPLSIEYYPHSTARNFEDIDIFIPEEYHYKVKEIFLSQGYSSLPVQSLIEKKPSFLKLMGSHVYMFEIHDYLYTTYFTKHANQFISIQGKHGVPSTIQLFISIIFHHKYFETRIRDLIDLEYIYQKEPSIDFQSLVDFSKQEHLYKHLLISIRLCENIIDSLWTTKIKNRKLKSFFNLMTVDLIYYLKKASALYLPFKRNIFTKFLDMILTLFIYDNLSTGLKCFFNKYIKYVRYEKYLMVFFKQFKK